MLVDEPFDGINQLVENHHLAHGEDADDWQHFIAAEGQNVYIGLAGEADLDNIADNFQVTLGAFGGIFDNNNFGTRDAGEGSTQGAGANVVRVTVTSDNGNFHKQWSLS